MSCILTAHDGSFKSGHAHKYVRLAGWRLTVRGGGFLPGCGATLMVALLVALNFSARAQPPLAGGANSTPGTGTVAYWPFNNPANPGADGGLLGNNLAVAGGSLAVTNDGPSGGSVYLDGQTTLTNQAGGVPLGLPTNASPYSLAVWERADGACDPHGGFLGWGVNLPGGANNFRLNGPHGADNYWYANDFVLTGLAADPMDGQWHALVVTWDGTNQTIYLDGMPAGTQTPAPPTVQGVNFSLGKTTADSNFTGWLADVLIADHALTATEVATYQAGNWAVAPVPGPPVATPGGPLGVGATVTLTIAAAGTPPFQYQWQQNGSNVPGATNATLTLSNLTAAGFGSYSVLVGNPAGTNASPAVWLQLNPPMGTIAYWQFNNPSNLGADSTPLNHALTLAGGQLIYTNDGPSGGSIYLDGQTTLTNVSGGFAAGLPTNGSPYSIAVWERTDPACAANGGFVGWGLNNYGEGNNWRLNGAGGLDNYWYGNDFTLSGLATDPMDGRWHALVATYDGTTQTIYVDGVPVGTRTPLPPRVQGVNFMVGRTTADANFTGWLADLLIADRALAPAEVAVYQAGQWAVAPAAGTPVASPAGPYGTGASVTLTVAATGTLPLQYQWQQNGTNVPGATNASMTLPSLTVANFGNYTVLVGNAAGTNTSPAVTLQLTPPLGTVAYWQFNDPANLGGDHGPLGNTLAVAGGQLVYNNTGPSGGSVYLNGQTTLTNLAGGFPTGLPTNASPYTIAVWEKADPACAASGGFAGWGSNQYNECNSWRLNGPGSLANYWYGNDFTPGGLATDPLDGHWHALVVTYDGITQTVYVDGVNAGSRTPVPPNVQGANFVVGKTTADVNFTGWLADLLIADRALTPAEVAVYQAGQWAVAPAPGTPVASPAASVPLGTNLTLSVALGGTPPFQYQWQFNGANLPGATNATLVLASPQVTDSGNYAVRVANALGTNQSPALTVSIQPPSPPFFTQSPLPVVAYQNDLAVLTATVDGSLPISLQWQCNGTNLPGQNLARLMLPNLQTNQTGAYALVASNWLGRAVSASAQLTVLPIPTNRCQNVLTTQHDNGRTGADTNEYVLTPAAVTNSGFGLVFTQPVDGAVYAQPLYVSGLNLPGQGVHNVVFVATQHGTVYAFDADGNQGANAAPLWQTSLVNPAAGVTPITPADVGGCGNIPYEECIAATPVIDLAGNAIYLEALTRETTNGVPSYVHRLHALNLLTGQEQSNSPVVIGGAVPGSGDGGDAVVFNPRVEQCRTGLLLQDGVVYFGYSSQCDYYAYHGWVMAYDARTLQQEGVYCDTPNGGQGGIWQSGGGLAGDPSGAVLVMTGNGDFGTNYSDPSLYNMSDSVLKFSPGGGLVLTDYFTPFNQAALNGADLDLSAGSPLVLPDAAGSPAHPHLLAGAGKDGTLYLLDRDSLGHFNGTQDSQVVQEIPNAIGTPWNFLVPAWFNHTLYFQGNEDVLRGFPIAGAVINTNAAISSSVTFGGPGGVPAISANGTNDGIVWALETDAWPNGGPAVLHAYNATNLAELYNSSQIPGRDVAGAAVKWTVPTVAGGKVYVGGDFSLSVYGKGVFLPPPTISPLGGMFTNAITVTLADAAPGAALYYTLDGSIPGTNSTLYTGPLLLTNSAGLNVRAALPGAVNSQVVLASFLNHSAVGTGTGLTGAYYAGQLGTMTNTPTLVRVDPLINFNWSTAGPAPMVPQQNFTVAWTGSVQPQFDETYTFYGTADDGIRLRVNGQEVFDGWEEESTATYQGSIALKAGQLYNLELDYFQGCCAAVVELRWSSPSTPLADVPTSQLYPYTNPPPVVVISAPTNGATLTGGASVTVTANAAAQYNPLSQVVFYTNGACLGGLTNPPYTLTLSGLAPGRLALTAVAKDGSGLASTSAPVTLTVNAGSGLPYGLTNRPVTPAYFNMPASLNGGLPATLSQAGLFADTANLEPAAGLLPYSPNTPAWVDGAAGTHWFAVPFAGGQNTPDQQIGFAPTGAWTFPGGAVFVQNLALATDQTNTNTPLRRLETRVLVCDPYGAAYGVTYKWRPDNRDADLLTNSLAEPLVITNATGTVTQVWNYPSPSACLNCHNANAGYVLGVNTRQLNGSFNYPATGVADNQLRTLNQLGLFNPALDEAGITNLAAMVAVTNDGAPLVCRVKSYIDANCADCHQPGGAGPSFDARYDTALTNQSLINGPVIASLGVDNAHVVNPQDIWRSMLYQRADSLARGVRMPPAAHSVADSNALAVVAGWIGSLPGIPALPPPAISPAGGTFVQSVQVSLQPPDTNATVYYTLDGSLPTPASLAYAGPFALTNSATVTVNAWEAGYTNSIATSSRFAVQPPVVFTGAYARTNGGFAVQVAGVVGKSYVLQTSCNLVNWVSLSTNLAPVTPFFLLDPAAPAGRARFYRCYQQP